jgi:hypothetical protein
MRPHLKDIPIISKILPDVPAEASPELLSREIINEKYTYMLNENTELQKQITELNSQITDKKDLEGKYKTLLKESPKDKGSQA